MLTKRRFLLPLLGWICISFAASWGIEAARAADHGDTPLLIGAGRHDGRLTGLFAFLREDDQGDDQLVLIATLDPTIPPEAEEYQFASDLRVEILIDNDSAVTFDDAYDLLTHGGTIVQPHRVQEDITFRIEFDEAGEPILAIAGLPMPPALELSLFVGLQDDPFIRGPRLGRNIAAIVLELPLDSVLNDQSTLLIWATSSVEDLSFRFQDLAGRALRSQFPENDSLNSLHPRRHLRVLGVPPDVVIFDTALPASFPNGRELTDDVVDLVGDERVLATEAPLFPDENDVPFLDEFPYLALPQ